VAYFSQGRRGKAELSDLDFAVDELAVVYPILNAIFDSIPLVAEETGSFVRGRIGSPQVACATHSIAHDRRPGGLWFPILGREKVRCAQYSLCSEHHELNPAVFKSSARQTIAGHLLDRIPVLPEISRRLLLGWKFRLHAASLARGYRSRFEKRPFAVLPRVPVQSES
jgi:hypothetical protein